MSRSGARMVSGHDRTQALFDKLQHVSRPSSACGPEAVHQLRTTIRRVETVLGVQPEPGRRRKKFLKQLARLRRRAGKVRDVDVQIEALKGLRLEAVARDRARVMSFLQQVRAKQEKKLLKALRNEMEAGLGKRLKRMRLRYGSPRPVHLQAAAEERFREAALEKFAAIVKRRPTLDESNLHEFRLDSKRVRFLAEMAGPRAADVVGQLKRIQDSVGAWHDWLTLAATAKSVLSPAAQAPLVSALRAATRSRYLEALRITAEAKQALLKIRESELTAHKPAASSSPSAVTAMAAAAIA
jgi:CHAD domain-containing protein